MAKKPQSVPQADLLQDFPRGRHNADHGEAAFARFERTSDIAATESLRVDVNGNADGKILFGVVDGAVCSGSRLPNGRRERYVTGGHAVGLNLENHIITGAGSRSGKGRAALVQNCCIRPADSSTVIVDPKEEISEITIDYRADALGQQCFKIGPHTGKNTKHDRFRAAFNPFDLLDPNDPASLVTFATLIADAIIISSGQKDEHWDDCARLFLIALIVHIATAARYAGRRDLISVNEELSTIDEADEQDPDVIRLDREMQLNSAANGYVQSGGAAFFGRTGGEYSSVLSTLRKHMAWVGMPAMRNALRGKSIDLKNIKRQPMCIYVCVPAMLMSILAGWVRLVVQMTLAVCEADPVRPKHNVLLIADEFHILGRMTAIEKAIAQIAGFGVTLWVVVQDFGQLKVYPNWESFVGNAGVVQAFGNSDMMTLEYLSKMLGTTQVMTPSVNAPTYEAAVQKGASGQSWSLATHPLLTPTEISRFFGRDDPQLRQLILRPGYRPMVLQRIFYDKHEFFQGMTKGDDQ